MACPISQGGHKNSSEKVIYLMLDLYIGCAKNGATLIF